VKREDDKDEGAEGRSSHKDKKIEMKHKPSGRLSEPPKKALSIE
jgi:hypothetical protein